MFHVKHNSCFSNLKSLIEGANKEESKDSSRNLGQVFEFKIKKDQKPSFYLKKKIGDGKGFQKFKNILGFSVFHVKHC